MSKRRPRGYWSKVTVADEITKRHRDGKDMRPIDIQKDDGGLYQAVKMFYGDWRKLYKELHIEVEVQNRRPRGYWTNEAVIKEVNEWHRKGYELNAGAVSEENKNLYHAAIALYGSWGDALEASGFKDDDIRINKSNGTWTKEYVISEIRRLGDQGSSLTPTDVKDSSGSLYTYGIDFFGGWDKALEASGYDADAIYNVRRPRGYWTKESVMQYLADRHVKGYSISSGTINNGAGFGSLYREAIKYYGSWSNVRSEVAKYIWEQS